MDGLSADKLRIFLHPIDMDSKPKKKVNPEETQNSDDPSVTTVASVDKKDQVVYSSNNFLSGNYPTERKR